MPKLSVAWGRENREKGEGPPRELVLGTLFIVAGFLSIFAGIFPVSEVAPTTLPAVIGVLSVTAGVVALLIRRPMSDALIDVYAIGGILALSFLIGNAKTELGTAISAMPYLWFCVFFGLYLEPAVARILIGFLCFCFGLALIVSEVATSVPLWVIFSSTMVITTEALLATSHALRVLARQDPLTGLLNRRGLKEAIGPVAGISERIGRPMTVAAIDLDDFKKVNDSQGHFAGDRILTELTKAWVANKREADLIARLGGDEFVIVMPATGKLEGKVLIDRLKELSDISWSCGIVQMEKDEELFDALERADRELYGAKASRRSTSGDAVPESE